MSVSQLGNSQAAPAPDPVSAQPEADQGERVADQIDESVRGILGERGIPSVNRIRSMQSRVTTVLAVGCMSVIGIGLLGWYYTQAFTRQQRAVQSAQSTSREQARSDLALPPLGHFDTPKVVKADATVSAPSAADAPSTMAKLLGPAPELPPSGAIGLEPAPYGGGSSIYPPQNDGVGAKSPAQLALERKLGGAVFTTAANHSATLRSTESPNADSGAMGLPGSLPTSVNTGEAVRSVGDMGVAAPSRQTQGVLASALTPTVTAAVEAKLLPTQRLLLPKGAFLDCTLETAIDSTLPGMVTCITASDTFGADGTTVLIERGSKLIGESQGDVRQGAARVFVLWDEVRTPQGVVVPLASPGTDEIGRSGLPGEVNRHFFQRFGAAILVSIIQGAVQAAAQPRSGGTAIYDPSTSANITTEVLRSTVNIPPTITKSNGDRIQVLVAHDLDFRSVYALHLVETPR
jgi:type IV secretion system protein VirB10